MGVVSARLFHLWKGARPAVAWDSGSSAHLLGLLDVAEMTESRTPIFSDLRWPVQVPDRLWGGMAAKIEAARTAAGDYPPEWPAVAWLVKTMADWKCERCGVPHGAIPNVLTVHHLDGVKSNLEHWNLAALCQRCHLRVQGRVTFFQDWPFDHSPWMAVHVADYNEWAARHGEPALTLAGIAPRSYANEWPA